MPAGRGGTPELEISVTGPKYNLLLITVDTLRADYLGANGYDLDVSPAIDRLISESLYFSKAVTPIPRTTQALASLLTGSYPYQTDVRHLWDKLSRKTITLAEILKKTGYRTTAVVSNHLLGPQRDLDRGFEVYDFGTNKRDASATSQAAIRYLKTFAANQPFFLWVHFIDPHMPYFPPEELARWADPDYRGRYASHFGAKGDESGEEVFPREIGKERAIFHNDLGDKVNRHIRRLYAADIKYTDLGIKGLLEAIEEPFGRRTVVVFTADHGESLGEHDYYYDHGDYLYSSEVGVPLAFKLPSDHPLYDRGRIDAWVSLVDVLPTVLDLISVEVRSGQIKNIDGRSLKSYWEDRGSNPAPIFAESDDSFYPESVKRRVRNDIEGRFRCVLFKDWKLIWTPFQTKERPYELFNIERDPHERHDLYVSNHPEVPYLRGRLQEWAAQQSREFQDLPPGKDDLEILRSLGYIR